MNPAQAGGHTPTPWRVEWQSDWERFVLIDGTGRQFGHFCGWSLDGITTQEEDHANAAFIAHAVNNHAALLAALKVAHERLRCANAVRTVFQGNFAVDDIEAAIALAEKEDK